ncbi:prospero-related homeobox 1 [Anopheles sinensis]|uniref:Prospero-related homeobox 1 n=1 Tax=Anopheles sinensis TaxID=74873 RepID=A0A084W123_ANOSI|nr:prospero-related homeobox 1 [Anopheles sinensis]
MMNPPLLVREKSNRSSGAVRQCAPPGAGSRESVHRIPYQAEAGFGTVFVRFLGLQEKVGSVTGEEFLGMGVEGSETRNKTRFSSAERLSPPPPEK